MRRQETLTVIRALRQGDFAVAAGLLCLALLLGGGSAVSPIQRMIVELAGVGALGWFAIRGWRAPTGRAARMAMVLIAALGLLLLLQLVPLPPEWWRTLPGRSIPAAMLDAAGAPETWLPLSIDPAATREAGLFLIPPIAMFVATLHLDRTTQLRLALFIVVAATVSAVLVMIQAQGAAWLTLYSAPHATKGKGIFANKNHNAALLVTAIPLAAIFIRQLLLLRQPSTQRLLVGVVIAFLAVAVVGCLSRAGLALLPVALLACIPLAGGGSLPRRHWPVAITGAVALVIIAVIVAQSSIARETMARFDASQEGRYVFWPDVIATVHQLLPWGSGIGTFVPVFRMNETLAAVHETYTNHAHADFLEIVFEAGIPGALLLAAFLIWFVVTAWARVYGRRGTADAVPLFAAATGMILLLAASMIDYPLRTLSLACVFAFLAGMLASPAPFPAIRPDDRRQRGRFRRGAS
jgi:O-antigen ligase